MDIQTFIDNYQETFSGKAELPIAFWYSDSLLENGANLKQRYTRLFIQGPSRYQARRDYQIPPCSQGSDTINHSFEKVEVGLLFLATPDILSGLITWTFFDNNNRRCRLHTIWFSVVAPP